MRIFAPAFETNVSGVIAQLVEQRTENPCVPGSIPGGTTKKRRDSASLLFFSVPVRFGLLEILPEYIIIVESVIKTVLP